MGNSLILKEEIVCLERVSKGELKRMWRDVTINNADKYLDIDANGDIVTIPYNSMTLRCGDKEVVVSIVNAERKFLVDANGKFEKYEYQGDQMIKMGIDYELGEIINTNIE